MLPHSIDIRFLFNNPFYNYVIRVTANKTGGSIRFEIENLFSVWKEYEKNNQESCPRFDIDYYICIARVGNLIIIERILNPKTDVNKNDTYIPGHFEPPDPLNTCDKNT